MTASNVEQQANEAGLRFIRQCQRILADYKKGSCTQSEAVMHCIAAAAALYQDADELFAASVEVNQFRELVGPSVRATVELTMQGLM